MGYFKFQELAGSKSYATDEYTTYIGLRHLKSWMLSDLLVFHIVFPNCTMIQDINHQEKVPRRGGAITFGDLVTPYMPFEKVASNSLHVENITDLSSPIPPIKPTELKFTELLDKNFTIHTYSDDEHLNEIDKWSKLVEEADPKNNIVQKYIRIYEKIHNFTSIEPYNLSQNLSYVGYLEKIKNCDNTAFMGWYDEIESSRLHLDDILFNSGRHYDKEFISTSEEMLFQLRIGWTLKDVTIVTSDLPQRISTLVESGIGKEWKTIETFVRHLQLAIKTNSRPIPLPTLKLNDNISAVFYVHCVITF
ncbi:unnamed protein product [Orchesella dallaii]|uniref:Uncharacterized protein n=1 Tax=Orchesella dallaii TaxID=48710 RepID=A0ABP1QK71_9HEXA